MKFPYISVEPIIAEAVSDARKLLELSEFTDDDCYTWAIDAARQIGGHFHDTDECYIDISKHGGQLPRNFYLIDEIWNCIEAPNTGAAKEPVSPNPNRERRWVRSAIMRPADTNSMKYCNRNRIHPMTSAAILSYTVKVPPGIVKTSFFKGAIYLKYLKVPMENGIVQIQDEINCILATKWYIKLMLIQSRYLLGEVTQNVYDTVNREFEDYLQLAQQAQKMPNPADSQFRAVEQDAKYRNFSYKNRW